MGNAGNAGTAVGVKLLQMGQELLKRKEAWRMELPKELPVLPARGVVFFPNLVLPLAVSGESDEKLVHDAVMGDRLIAVHFAIIGPTHSQRRVKGAIDRTDLS